MDNAAGWLVDWGFRLDRDRPAGIGRQAFGLYVVSVQPKELDFMSLYDCILADASRR